MSLSLDLLFLALCIAWPLGEAWIGLRHRPDHRDEARDQGTLPILLIVIFASVVFAVGLAYAGLAPFPTTWRLPSFTMGIAMMAIGIPLRWWSVRTLSRLFTIRIAIREGHRLIRSGPYRLLRHPSYTGALLTFAGFGLALGDGLALIAAIVPVTMAFLHRIRIEEHMLAQAFPDEYPAYARATKRLLPLLW